MARKFLAAIAATAGLALTATAAHAATFTGSWTLAAHESGSGLEVDYTPITGNFSFNLSPSTQSISIDLFDIYTNEGSVNWCNSWLCGGGGNDDVQAKPISLTFAFSAPTPNAVEGPIGGVTNGQVTLFGLFQNGVLNWTDDARFDDIANPFNPSTGGYTLLNFGPGTPAEQGQLSIRVNGGTFNNGVGGLNEGPDGALRVSGFFHWDRDPTGAVPEPATWALMIGGFGMAGATLRRRRALATTA